jgi:hypothetical protein
MTTPYGLKLGIYAFPVEESGHHSWDVMAHEQGHNFFGGTSGFYGSLAFPYPFLQESLAVLSALYTYHHTLSNLEEFGIEEDTRQSLDYVFSYEKSYQGGQYGEYISQGKNFDIDDILTSQALDYKMIEYGNLYGWESFKNLAKAFQDGISDQFTFHNDGVSDKEQSTYIIAALSASFNKDFRQEFYVLNFPIDEYLYEEVHPKIIDYLNDSE